MSCRWGRAPTVRVVEDLSLCSVYRELARAGRWEDFCWLARSQGLSREVAAALWRQCGGAPVGRSA
jgi:hypothetical protein